MQKTSNVKTFLRSDFTSDKVSTAPLISITPNDGNITFNAAACRMTGFRDGVILAVRQDSVNPRRLGFVPTSDTDGFAVLPRNDKRTTYRIVSRALVRHLAAGIDLPGVLHAQIASEPEEDGTWWVLESSWKNTPSKKNSVAKR